MEQLEWNSFSGPESGPESNNFSGPESGTRKEQLFGSGPNRTTFRGPGLLAVDVSGGSLEATVLRICVHKPSFRSLPHLLSFPLTVHFMGAACNLFRFPFLSTAHVHCRSPRLWLCPRFRPQSVQLHVLYFPRSQPGSLDRIPLAQVERPPWFLSATFSTPNGCRFRINLCSCSPSILVHCSCGLHLFHPQSV